jgi:carbon-monoxide dehydrogenase small subunit
MVMSAKYFLDRNPDPTEEQIRKGLSGNLCRCTGYNRIVEAIGAASVRMKNAGKEG